MSHTIHPYRALAAIAGISTALCLSACGGSSKPVRQAGSHTSTAAQSSTSTSTCCITTATRTLNPAVQLQARRAALTIFVACLRKHGIRVPSRDLSVNGAKLNTAAIDKTAHYQKVGAACLPRATAVYDSATATAVGR